MAPFGTRWNRQTAARRAAKPRTTTGPHGTAAGAPVSDRHRGPRGPRNRVPLLARTAPPPERRSPTGIAAREGRETAYRYWPARHRRRSAGLRPASRPTAPRNRVPLLAQIAPPARERRPPAGTAAQSAAKPRPANQRRGAPAAPTRRDGERRLRRAPSTLPNGRSVLPARRCPCEGRPSDRRFPDGGRCAARRSAAAGSPSGRPTAPRTPAPAPTTARRLSTRGPQPPLSQCSPGQCRVRPTARQPLRAEDSWLGAPVSDRHRAAARNLHRRRRPTPISRPGNADLRSAPHPKGVRTTYSHPP